MVQVNNLLLLALFLCLVYTVFNQSTTTILIETPSAETKATLVDRTGSDWNQSGHLVSEVGLKPELERTLPTWANQKTTVYTDINQPIIAGGGHKVKTDLTEPDYYHKTEIFTSDYFPWWRNQHFWPYYTRSHNWMYRYPYYSYWRRPYYYNYWASPYYPSRTVLVKPYLKDLEAKTRLRKEISDRFRTSKISD